MSCASERNFTWLWSWTCGHPGLAAEREASGSCLQYTTQTTQGQGVGTQVRGADSRTGVLLFVIHLLSHLQRLCPATAPRPRVWEDRGKLLEVRGPWEGTRGESSLAEGSESHRSHSPVWQLHSGSLFLIIRANYVQAKGEHDPKFMSLCATTTICVLCSSPEKLLL